MNLESAVKNLKGVVVHTGGHGYWSHEPGKEVEIDRVEHYVSPGDRERDIKTEHFLKVYFTPSTWDVNRHGLIYTDDRFLKEFRSALRRAGYHSASKTYYTEQGMQGEKYVHLIVGGQW